MKKSITYKGSVLWNNLSNESRKLESLDIFKNTVAEQESLSATLFGLLLISRNTLKFLKLKCKNNINLTYVYICPM